MTPKPDTAAQTRAALVADAAKLIRLLISKCDSSDHDGVECRRCLALFDVQSRQPFALKLLNAAIAALDAAPSQPTAREVLEEALMQWNPKDGWDLLPTWIEEKLASLASTEPPR